MPKLVNVDVSLQLENDVSSIVANNLKVVPGLWIDGRVEWLTNGTEKILDDKQLTIKMKSRLYGSTINIYDVYICNHANYSRECKILFANQFVYLKQQQFTFISPVDEVIFHLDDGEIYLINSCHNGKTFNQSTVQPLWNFQSKDIWNDMSQGRLQYQPMAKGASVSIVAMDLLLHPKETTSCSCWQILGRSKSNLLKLNDLLMKSY